MIKLGILMDNIMSIDIKKDTSFVMLLEAQFRGYKIYYMEINDIYLRTGISYARTRLLKVKDNYDSWYQFGTEQEIKLSNLDIILIRKDPPFDIEFMYVTHILERAEEEGVLIVNKPQSLRDCNEKLYATCFPEYTPDTLVTRNKDKIRSFLYQYGEIILKSLDGMAGKSIFRITNNDPNFSVIVETLTKNGTIFCIAQNYIPEIKYGDKRVIIIDGKPIPYCLVRIPKAGETRGNLAAGGFGEPRKITENDFKVASYIGSMLKIKDLIFVGIDIIGDKLIEINVTSPTCVRQIELAFPISIIGIFMDALEKRLELR